MPFYPAIYTKRYSRFHSCGKCGKRFTEGEKIWKRAFGNAPPNYRSNGAEHPRRITEYLCVECYEEMYIDV